MNSDLTFWWCGKRYLIHFTPALLPWFFRVRYIMLDDDVDTVLEFKNWTEGFPTIPYDVFLLGTKYTLSMYEFAAIWPRLIEAVLIKEE